MGTYYVAKTGDDANPGTLESPFLTIGAATDVVAAGDTVHVGAGEYRERVIMDATGTAAQPIVFEGALDGNGDNAVTINGSDEDYSDYTWIPAPEVHADCWKTEAGKHLYGFLVDGKHVGVLYSMAEGTTGNAVMYAEGEHYIDCSPYGDDVGYYDTLGVAIAHSLPYPSACDAVYMRFADGSDPATHDIQLTDSGWYALSFQGCAYVSVSQFDIIGALYGVSFHYYANHNTLDSCTISKTNRRVNYISDCHDNTVSNCEMFADKYGSPQWGAWGVSDNYDTHVHAAMYRASKYYWRSSSTEDYNFRCHLCGTGNVISDCTLHDGAEGIFCEKAPGVTIQDCNIYNHSSVGICPCNTPDMVVSGCTIDNANHNMRFHRIKHTTGMSLTATGNTFVKPDGFGKHIHIDYYDHESFPEWEVPAYITLTGNTFQGGEYVLYQTDQADEATYHALQSLIFNNNEVISASAVVHYCGADFYSSVDSLTECSGNAFNCEVSNRGNDPAWLGRTTFVASTSTIEWALALARIGDTIRLAAGTYTDRKIPNQDEGMNVVVEVDGDVDIVSWGLVSSNWLSAALWKTHDDPDRGKLIWP